MVFLREMIMIMNITVRNKLILNMLAAVLVVGSLIIISANGISNLAKLQDLGAKRADDSSEGFSGAFIGSSMYEVIADSVINHNLEESERDWTQIKQESQQKLDRLAILADTTDEKHWAIEAQESFKNITNLYETEMLPLLKANDRNSQALISQIDGKIDGHVKKINVNLSKFAKSMQQEAVDADAQFDATGKTTLRHSIVVGLLILALLITLSLWIFFSLMNQLGGEPSYAQDIALRVAKGDISTDVTLRKGDTTSLLAFMQNMQVNLRILITGINIGANSIANGAQEISAGNTNLSQRTEEQASSLEETASSMEQMASTVKQNAEYAKQANIMANEASSVAVKGGHVVSEVVKTMDEINTSSKKIVDIISVIDSIAFQTNILALNAAVEAARAGEQGRGFAVVASEVRNLAQRSASAAKEIKQLIANSVEKVQSGTLQVQKAGETMDEIVTAVKMVTDIVNEIAAASQEQSAGIDQVNKAIANMDEVTQQNAALVEEAAAAAESLEAQAHELTESVSQFKLAKNDGQHTFTKQNASAQSQNGSTRAELNEVKVARTAELQNVKKANGSKRLKAPKAKAEDAREWEEF
jgi:methyl-accepting chemotaxis protein